MILNPSRENDASVIFTTNDIFVSSTSLHPSTTTSIDNINEPLVGNMLDAELDSDPQISDSELSWQSVTDVDSLTATNHWRGWKQQTATNSSLTARLTSNLLSSANSTVPCFSLSIQSNEG